MAACPSPRSVKTVTAGEVGSHGGERRRFDPEFREGAVRIVTEAGKPIAKVAKNLDINETTLASWVSRARRAGIALDSESDELERLRRENAQLKRDNKELVMERDVLKRCMVLIRW
jgi:transposase